MLDLKYAKNRELFHFMTDFVVLLNEKWHCDANKRLVPSEMFSVVESVMTSAHIERL